MMYNDLTLELKFSFIYMENVRAALRNPSLLFVYLQRNTGPKEEMDSFQTVYFIEFAIQRVAVFTESDPILKHITPFKSSLPR